MIRTIRFTGLLLLNASMCAVDWRAKFSVESSPVRLKTRALRGFFYARSKAP
jgi:hypothetical protein